MGDDGFVYASDGDEVPWLVAEAASDCGNGPAPDFDTPYNAHLIAAAPGLYDDHDRNLVDLGFLRRAVAEGDPMAELLIRIDDIVRRTKAALSLARGEQLTARDRLYGCPSPPLP